MASQQVCTDAGSALFPQPPRGTARVLSKMELRPSQFYLHLRINFFTNPFDRVELELLCETASN